MNLLNRVTIEKHNQHVAIVSLNRPDKYNALDFNMMQALIKAKKIIDKDRDIRVVILKGNGPSFCAGLDVSNFKSSPVILFKNILKFGKVDNLFQRCVKVWRDLRVPVIAVVHGNCFGGGLQIALGADFRFSSPDAKISFMEGKWGLIPDMGALLSAPEIMRLDHFMELTMTAKIIDANRAKEYGVITKIKEDPLQSAIEFSEELLLVSPDAHAAAKKMVRKAWKSNSPRTLLFWETWVQIKLLVSGKNVKVSIDNNLSQNSEKKKKPFKNRFF